MSKFDDVIKGIQETKKLEAQNAAAASGARMSYYINGSDARASDMQKFDTAKNAILSKYHGKPGTQVPNIPTRAGLVDESSTLIELDGTGFNAPGMAKAKSLKTEFQSLTTPTFGARASSMMDYRKGTSAAASMLKRRL